MPRVCHVTTLDNEVAALPARSKGNLASGLIREAEHGGGGKHISVD